MYVCVINVPTHHICMYNRKQKAEEGENLWNVCVVPYHLPTYLPIHTSLLVLLKVVDGRTFCPCMYVCVINVPTHLAIMMCRVVESRRESLEVFNKVIERVRENFEKIVNIQSLLYIKKYELYIHIR